jgi:hypothetical protein
MDSTREDRFAQACARLEKVQDLFKRELIDESEWKSFREILVSSMKEAARSSETEIESDASRPRNRPSSLDQVPSYASLHAQLVEKLASAYLQSGGDDKQFVFRAMNEMAEKGALFNGDSEPLTNIIEIVFRPCEPVPSEASDAPIRDVLTRVNEIALVKRSIQDSQFASPAAKAIADVTHGAATLGSNECLKPAKQAGKGLRELWKELVWPDVKGAFWGGAQAANLSTYWAPGIALHLGSAFPLFLPLFAASGVLIGASTESGLALGQHRKT